MYMYVVVDCNDDSRRWRGDLANDRVRGVCSARTADLWEAESNERSVLGRLTFTLIGCR